MTEASLDGQAEMRKLFNYSYIKVFRQSFKSLKQMAGFMGVKLREQTMVPQGPPTPHGGAQPVPPSLLRSNSGLLGGQGGGMPSQNAFPSLVSPRNQFNNLNMLGNVPNVSSLFHQSFVNGGPSSGLSGPGSSQRGLLDGGAESGVGNGMGFNTPSSSYISSSITANPNSSGQVQGQQQFSNPSGSQMMTDQQQAQQLDPQNFQHNQQQFSMPSNSQQQQQSQQQQFQSMRPGLGGVGPVKLEPQTNNEQAPQLQALRNIGSVKMEPQQLQSMRSSSQAAAAAQILHQQRLMQIQHQQQQQLLKAMPQQRSPLQPQFQPQNMPIRSPVKPVYEPGMCARRLTHYMYQQQHRPEDNNIEFWRKFVAEYFAPNAKKKWCVSMYGSGRQTTGVFPQATVEVLPRLFKIKYESGTLEELLYVDMPREYQNSSGQIVLDYAKAIQESVFEQLRVVRDGQLRIVFSPDLKICSWEFCARRHEELIPRRLLIPQVSQLGTAAQKYQAATQNTSPSVSVSELQNNCNMFVASARQLAKALEVPLVNDLGYTKRYVRCLQISEVVNSMKDLIDYSRETGAGPMESLAKFPRRTNPSPAFQGQAQQPEGQHQQTMNQNSNNDNSVQPAAMQLASTTGTPSANNNAMNSGLTTSSTSTIVGLLHQNSMNSRHQNPISSQPAISGDADANDSQSSVQKIIHDMMMSSQLGGGGMVGLGSDMKNVNGVLSTSGNAGMNGGNILVGTGVANGNAGIGVSGFGSIGNGLGQSAMVNGIRAALGNNSLSMNGRVGMTMGREQSMNSQQQDMSNQLLTGLGAVNGFNNLQFDWKASP
ncbi:hypothetical protein DH2020_007900 [Rehmannia glutinosa]|uniref:Transcriptional corepressor SEUSS-like protein n=1 Tax=Rehmannia glutinosa TaxID=99300 RepID=A0ABR0U0C6_REHGL